MKAYSTYYKVGPPLIAKDLCAISSKQLIIRAEHYKPGSLIASAELVAAHTLIAHHLIAAHSLIAAILIITHNQLIHTHAGVTTSDTHLFTPLVTHFSHYSVMLTECSHTSNQFTAHPIHTTSRTISLIIRRLLIGNLIVSTPASRLAGHLLTYILYLVPLLTTRAHAHTSHICGWPCKGGGKLRL